MSSNVHSVSLSGVAPVLFVSDLHLNDKLPKTCAAFFHFIKHTAVHAQALFILGDLFEYWIGDDCLRHASTLATKVAADLAELSRRGVAVYILPGNRDFLLGLDFAKQAGATLLSDICVLHTLIRNPETTLPTATTQTFVLAHGDTLCTDDERYQHYRRWVHKRWVQKSFLALPLKWRLKLAHRLHTHSQTQQKKESQLSGWQDVNNEAVQTLLQQSQAQILIHGHTHRPHCHRLAQGIRWVLSDWDLDHAQRASYLCLKHGTLSEIAYRCAD